MRRESDTLKGFTIIETMLFLALTGLMLVGAMVGIGTNLTHSRYRDSVEDIAIMIRNQYDQVNRVQIERRTDTGVCELITGDKTYSIKEQELNLGRGRSNCDVYGIAIIFGLNDPSRGPGRVVQVNSLVGKDVKTLEKEIQEEHATDVLPPDPNEAISRMTDQQLFKELGINNVVERNNVCEAVNILDRKVLNWGAYLEDTYVEEDDGSHFPKKGIVLIIRSPRDGTVHTYTYNFSKDPNINVLDYSDFGQERCITAFIGSIDINDAFNQVDEEGNEKEMLFNNKRDFHLCISSDDALSTYGRRRMLTIKADGHNSSAVSLVDMESEDNKCQ